MAKKKRPERFRFGIMVLVCVIILAVTFFTYMISTSLDEVLADERGEGVIITHSSSEQQ